MSKKSIRIISIVFTIAIVFMLLSPMAFAVTPSEFTGQDSDVSTPIKNVGQRLIGIIQVVGTIIAVVIIMVLGIKYMMGSAEEKASYKKTMMPYIVGAILIFAASNIAQLVYNWSTELKTEVTSKVTTSIVIR